VTDDELRAAYQLALRANDAASHGHACPGPEALLAVLDGATPERERLDVLRHVAACADCRDDLDALRGVVEASSRVAVPAPGAGRPPALRAHASTPWLRAAALVIVVAGGGAAAWLGTRERVTDDRVRGGEARIVTLPAEGSPARGEPVRLRWRAVPGAGAYRVRVLAAAGVLRFEAGTADTTILVPASALGAPGDTLLWSVETTLAGRELRAPAQRLVPR